MNVIKINSVNSFNVFYNTIRKTPVFGQMLPISLYKRTKLKYTYKYVSFILRSIAQILIYLGIYFFFKVVSDDTTIIKDIPEILNILLRHAPFVLYIFMFANAYAHNPISKYLTVNNLDYIHFFKMNTKRYSIIIWIIDSMKVMFDTLLFLIMILAIYQKPLELSIFYLLIYMMIYTISQAKSLFVIEKISTGNKLYHIYSFLVFIVLCIASYYLYTLNIVLMDFRIVVVVLVMTILSIYYLNNYNYKYLYNYYFKEGVEHLKIKVDFEYVADVSETYKQHGYRYLNSLFFQRHKRGLYKNQMKKSKILFAMLSLLLAFMIFTSLKEIMDMKSIVLISLTLSMLSNSGSSYIRALFANCDVGLISYKFYRTKESIRQNAMYRYVQLLLLNTVSVLCIAVGGVISLLILNYSFSDLVMYSFIILVFNLSLSFYFIFIYYLFLPFDYQLLPTNGSVYYVVNILAVQFLFYMFSTKINQQVLFWLIIGISCVFLALGSIIIEVYGKKRFKVR